ncbi:hypothetical protein, variant [Aphanomyces invadans]|nr:hypothetical protein, variant [Aphanomyces invadans]ETW04892.1 hypothetical protein, variant [Aphanomyces invadans]|eukprot:XP_008866329.1 hypothetical protein, variant [Aphanomyces invadans]
MYREATESSNSLANDLIRLGMHWLWDGLQRHIQLQRLFDSYDTDKAGKLPSSQLQYLLGESGVVTTQTQVDALVYHLRAHAVCMDAILQRNRAIRLFGYKQLSRVDAHDERHIYRDTFVALRLSSWAPLPQPRWQHVGQSTKVHSYGWIRRAKAAVAQCATWIQRAALTGLLNLPYLTGKSVHNANDRGDYIVKVDVGKDFAANAELHLSYTCDCDSAATLHNLGYREDGAECFVYMDFLTKPDITDVELADTVTAMKTLFDVTWLGHLKSLPCFHKLLVLSPPKTQTHGTTIVRVVVLLTEAMDPFNFLLYLGFPSSLQFDQLVSRLRWTALFNVSANEILTNKRFNPAKHFAVRSVLNVCVGRQACGQIVEQACYQAKYEASSRYVEDEIIHRELQQHNEHFIATSASSTASTTPSKSDPRLAMSWNEQVKRSQQDVARKWHMWADKLAKFFKFSKTLSVNLHVASVANLLRADSVLHSLFHPDVLSEVLRVLSTTGSIHSIWEEWTASLEQELHELVEATSVDAPPTATTWRRQDHALHKSMLHVYDVLTSNVLGLNLVKGEAGTIGFSLLVEGFNIFPLLPKVPPRSSVS